jgi:hypothetical protein
MSDTPIIRRPNDLTLHQQQTLFPQYVALLIQWVYKNGYEVTFGECYRTPEQAALNAQSGAGISHSLHTQRLAIDLQLFKDGVYLTDTYAYTSMGIYWESLDPLCCWGGRFTTRPDGNHFSMTYGGVK